MTHLLRAAAVVLATACGTKLLTAIRNAPSAPRLLKWGAMAGLMLLAVRR